VKAPRRPAASDRIKNNEERTGATSIPLFSPATAIGNSQFANKQGMGEGWENELSGAN
jgi:hypothetical protein